MKKTHKKTFKTLLFVLLFLVAIIITIFFTQLNSQKSIGKLKGANASAVLTFEFNNRLQDIVNLVEIIEINSRHLYKTGNMKYAGYAEDTIQLIQTHIAYFNSQKNKTTLSNNFNGLIHLVEEKIEHIETALQSYITATNKNVLKPTDEMMGEDLDETIYLHALSIQRSLESDLKKTLDQSSRLSANVLRLDKILSVISILAIVVLGTLIIKRLLEQLKLINDLGIEKERADKSALIKEQFLANMSHEIRTPINAVVGFSNLLQKTSLEADQKQFVDLIQNSGENLLVVVNDILDISKLEAGMMRITKNPFSIRESCLSLEMMFFHKASEKNLSFSCEVDENLPDMLVGDAERLNQVLINLVNNAIKFTAEGEVNVNIKMEKMKGDMVDLVFSVKDSGVGIPKNKLDTIFERFEQADSETSRQYGGTGLGLSIVKKIIDLQGGSIKVESEPGEGSTFIFSITYSFIDNPEKMKRMIDMHTNDKVEFVKIKALVAEDNITNQTLLKFTLKQWNLEYDLAENGVLALELMKKNKYDIVLMDIQMPIMDGYEAARQIRKNLNTSIPMIAMTAHVLPTEKEKCISVGMNDYISKPLKEAELLKLLKKYLPHTSQKEEKAKDKQEPPPVLRYINLKYLHDIFPENNDFINEIMYQFREQYPRELKELKLQIENRNINRVMELVHHLKTTVSTLSIDTPLRIHLEKIEDYATEKKWIQIDREINTLLQKESLVIKEVDTVITYC